MNNWLLFFILSCLFFLFYIFRGRKIGPSNIFVLTYLVPISIIIYFSDTIQYDITLETVLIISFFLISFFIGETFVSQKIEMKCIKREPVNYEIKNSYLVLFYVVQIINLWLAYNLIRKIGAEVGTDDFISSMAASRLYVANNPKAEAIEIAQPFYAKFIGMLSLNSEIICAHLYVLKKVEFKEKGKQLALLGVILLYLFSNFFSTARAGFFPVMIHFIYLLMFFVKKKIPISIFIRKHIIKIVITFFILGGMFIMMGFLRGDTDGEVSEVSPSQTVMGYFGGSIVGLDLFVKDGMPRYKNVGAWTFKHYYLKLYNWGVVKNEDVFKIEPFEAGTLRTNIRSGIYYWIADFGLVGGLVFIFIVGCIYGVLIVYEKKRLHPNSIWGIYYSSLLYCSLIYVFFADMFYSSFSYSQIYGLIIISLLKKHALLKCNGCIVQKR